MPQVQIALINTVNMIGSKIYLRDEPLSMPVRECTDYVNRRWEGHLNCGNTIAWLGFWTV